MILLSQALKKSGKPLNVLRTGVIKCTSNIVNHVALLLLVTLNWGSVPPLFFS